jgi:transposase
MAIGLPAVPALDAGRYLGADAGGAERQRRGAGQRADDRQHGDPGAPSGGRRKRGTQKQGFGRSKGGFTTKLHLRTNTDGLPVAAEITGGEVSDYKGYDLVMADGGPVPKVFIADKGYDADWIRDDIEARGGVAVIPARRSRTAPVPVDGYIYALRNRVERCFNKLKNSRRLATRYDKTADSYLGFVHIAAVRLWIRYFVNRT